MTLAGKRNHYNVKFLKGYGHSIYIRSSKLAIAQLKGPPEFPLDEVMYSLLSKSKTAEVSVD